jgi:lipopolysaccharide/colanic/teichoic acid biosynthesis glycosyltransferase
MIQLQPESATSRPVPATLRELDAVPPEHPDEARMFGPSASTPYAEPLRTIATELSKTIRIVPDPVAQQLSGEQVAVDGFFPWSQVRNDPHELGLVAKRLIDIVGASFGLVVLAPLFLAVALAIRLHEGSTILFRQTRVGLDGRPFRIYKFRSMVTDAEARLADVAHLNMRRGPLFKAIDDPRITSIGTFLRRSSLDELPQLWNVLKGEMSLVGPRPPLPDEVARYAGWQCRRLSMKPGITGLWQVEARRDSGFDRLVECDLSYIDRWSLGLDLKILILTIPAVVLGTGR